MTGDAAALTYYALTSLFPTLLLAVSLPGLLGEYPATYDAIVAHLRHVVPSATLAPLNAAVRAALHQLSAQRDTRAAYVDTRPPVPLRARSSHAGDLAAAVAGCSSRTTWATPSRRFGVAAKSPLRSRRGDVGPSNAVVRRKLKCDPGGRRRGPAPVRSRVIAGAMSCRSV